MEIKVWFSWIKQTHEGEGARGKKETPLFTFLKIHKLPSGMIDIIDPTDMNGNEVQETSGGQRGLACCSPQSDTVERLKDEDSP